MDTKVVNLEERLAASKADPRANLYDATRLQVAGSGARQQTQEESQTRCTASTIKERWLAVVNAG